MARASTRRSFRSSIPLDAGNHNHIEQGDTHMTFKLQHIAIAAGFALATMAAPALADPIKIGFNVPLTGFAAADGNSAYMASSMFR